MRRVRNFPTRIVPLPTVRRWLHNCIPANSFCKALVAIVYVLALFLLLPAASTAHAQETPSVPQGCIESNCVTADPLGWQPNSVTQSLTVWGANFGDNVNRARFYFPAFSTFVPATINYTAFVSGAFDVGQVITSDNGEIVGLFTLSMTPKDGISFLPIESADETALPIDTAINHSSGSSDTQPLESSQFLADWTMRLDYAGCVTPIDCEFAKYDEASLRCYWYNPLESAWNLTNRSIDLNNNRLTCTSRTTGLHAIVARRAKTSGETEGAPVYLPIVRQGIE